MYYVENSLLVPYLIPLIGFNSHRFVYDSVLKVCTFLESLGGPLELGGPGPGPTRPIG